jgi:hypothetical protein
MIEPHAALWAVEEIKKLKARYFRLMDLQRWDEWAEVFTDDCDMYLGSGEGIAISGKAEIVARAAAVMATRTSVHHGHMPEIELMSERTATGVWSLYACSVDRDAAPSSTGATRQTYGHYFDHYFKGEDGRWRIGRVQLIDHLLVGSDIAASAAWAGGSVATVVASL